MSFLISFASLIFYMQKSLVIFLILVLNSLAGFCQHNIKGRVVDKDSKEPLAFVNITDETRTIGVISDIDGVFELKSGSPLKAIFLTYVGYQPLKYQLKNEGVQVIMMSKSTLSLKEVEILPGQNPAELIIQRVIQNKDRNNPNKMSSYKYEAYNKMYFTAEMNRKKADSLATVTDSAQMDSTYVKAKKFLDRQHVFLMETVSESKFLYPDKSSELVLAQRVSGLKDPSFATLFMQQQTFGFYKEQLAISDKNYLNPIADGAISKYLYIIKDTIYQGRDSVFVIQFQPRRLKKFESLKGLLYINSNGYAIQNVIAEPSKQTAGTNIKIQQQYEFIQNKHWFPVQLNTDITYTQVSLGGYPMVAIGRNYLKNIEFDVPLRRREFSELAIETHKDANNRNEAYWNIHRKDSLDKKELKTYHVVDSVGKAQNFDRKIKAAEALFTNKFPIKFVDLDLNRILNYNDYEGMRLGAGLSTNFRISRRFTLSGYGAYGFGDKAFKYGGNLDLYLLRKHELTLHGTYLQDVIESGGIEFYNNTKTLNNSEIYRKLLISRMDSIRKIEAAISFRAFKFLKANVYFNQQDRTFTKGYRFGSSPDQVANTVFIEEAGLSLYYAYNEQFIQIGRAMISQGTTYPVIYSNMSLGTTNLGSTYARFDLRITKTFDLNRLGKTRFTLQGGNIFYSGNPLPYSLLYNGIGSFNKSINGIVSENSFQTMRMNEFLSDEYAALFFRHNFGRIMYRFKKFQPTLAIEHNMGWGSLNSKYMHRNISFSTMEKGFFESGIVMDNLIRSGFTGLGVGCYYRYGSNSFANPKDNFAVKLSVSVAL